MDEKTGKILPDYLCARCGTCEGVCPEKIIVEDRNGFPFVSDKAKCTGCGLCKRVCPGKYVEFPLPEEEGGFLYNPLIGYYHSIMSAKSKDTSHRENSSSGGAVSSLLKYLLKSNEVDAVFTVGMNKEYPYDAYPVLAKTVEDIDAGRQSKYQPVMVNRLLQEIGDCEKIAVAGLPCHMHGIRKAEKEIKSVREKIYLRAGLFCGFNMERGATDFLVRKMGMGKRPLKDIRYRAGNWPGGFLIEDKEGRKRFTAKEDYSLLNYLYLPHRCSTCPDYSAEMSDISFGDAWYKKGEGGWNAVIIRNKKAKNLLHKTGLILEDADAEMIIDSHRFVIDFKKRGAVRRIMLSGETFPKFVNYPRVLEDAATIPFDRTFLRLYRLRGLIRGIFKYLPLFIFTVSSRVLRRKKIG